MKLVILKRQVGLPLRAQVAPGQRVHARHVFVGEHDKHAGCPFGGSGVDRHGPAIRDRAIDDCGVGYAFERNICRVACSSGHLEPAIDARDRLSDSVHARAPAVCNARRATRCASSTLKALWARGRASVNDAAIADLSPSMSSSEIPRNLVSAAVSRHGLCATPPMASRAARMRLPSVATPAAAETNANSDDARARTF